VGNAVTVNVAEWIGRRLVAVFAEANVEMLRKSVREHEQQAICV
jgi:hypothetical protein